MYTYFVVVRPGSRNGHLVLASGLSIHRVSSQAYAQDDLHHGPHGAALVRAHEAVNPTSMRMHCTATVTIKIQYIYISSRPASLVRVPYACVPGGCYGNPWRVHSARAAARLVLERRIPRRRMGTLNRFAPHRRGQAALAGLMLYSRLKASNSSSLPLYCSARDEITFKICQILAQTVYITPDRVPLPCSSAVLAQHP